MGGAVHEDIGYGGSMEDQKPYRINRKMVMIQPLVKIEYIKGMSRGDVKRLNHEIAEDLIRRGYARRIHERQPGEEG